MKNKLFTLAFASAMLVGLTSCGGSKAIELTVWVGSESTEFIKAKGEEFIKANQQYAGASIKVTATDTGANAGAMQTDNTACGDIVVVAHDNIGKLSQGSLIRPLTNQELLAQIDKDNPDAYKNVIKNYFGKSKDTLYTFGVPFVSQSLVLYYNKAYVTEDEAKSFEGLQAAAKKADAKALTVLGDDGFNFSFTVLAGSDANYDTSLKLYVDGNRADQQHTYFQGEDMIAVTQWAQRMFNDPNGVEFPTSSGWAVDLKQHNVLSLIGGAWNLNAAKDALGENMGVTILPTFTLTADDVDNTNAKVDTVMRAGTFSDCKVLTLNSACTDQTKIAMAQDFMKYISSVEIQKQSFKECGNLPAFEGAADYIESIKSEIPAGEYDLAVAQTSMSKWSIAQPFTDGTLNTYYYSMGAPAILKNMMLHAEDNVNGKTIKYTTTDEIRQGHMRMEYIWRKGKDPVADSSFEWPESYPYAF